MTLGRTASINLNLLTANSFLHRITTSEETTSRYFFQRGKLNDNNYNL